ATPPVRGRDARRSLGRLRPPPARRRARPRSVHRPRSRRPSDRSPILRPASRPATRRHPPPRPRGDRMTTTATRRSFTIELTPHPTPRFQPTGFPDLGPATYEAWVDNEWVRCILVESPQSMANRLEVVGWIADGDNSRPHPALDSLPYVRVEDEDGDFLASSRTEAHRLASAYVLDAVENGTQ